MNSKILQPEVQLFLEENLDSEISSISLSKSKFEDVTSAELATQIVSRKKAQKKLPTWFNTKGIYYPPALSIEQTSSEITASFKASLLSGSTLVDISAGFGVDSYYFSKRFDSVISCEVNSALSEISAHNAKALNISNITFLPIDGMEYLKSNNEVFDVIYADPARRKEGGKVFKLADCTPNIPQFLPLLLTKSKLILLKTAPLLDITAGISELSNVKKVYIVSVKNECKELLWLLEPGYTGEIKITAVTLNDQQKQFSFLMPEMQISADLTENIPQEYLYEPDAALLKSGAFSLIGQNYGLKKLDQQSQLYTSNIINTSFPGRIFKINSILKSTDLKKTATIAANVISRNYPEKSADIVKKYKIKPSIDRFLIFTKVNGYGYIGFDTEIIQHY